MMTIKRILLLLRICWTEIILCENGVSQTSPTKQEGILWVFGSGCYTWMDCSSLQQVCYVQL